MLDGFNNPNYYGGAYQFAPNSPSWELGKRLFGRTSR